MGQAAAKATEQIGEAAVEASGKASFTPKNSDEAARSGGQQRRPASRRSGEGKTTRGSKRGTRPHLIAGRRGRGNQERHFGV